MLLLRSVVPNAHGGYVSTIAKVTASRLREGYAAGEEAGCALLEELGAAPDVVMVFASEAYDQRELLRGVRAALPGVPLTGSSGEGIIHRGGSFETDYCVGLIGLRSDGMRLRPFLLEGYGVDSAAAGDALAELIEVQDDVFGVFVFPDGLQGNCERFLARLDQRLGPEPLVLGGTAGDGMRMEQTWQYLDDRAVSGGVSGMILSGRGSLNFAVSHGCTPIGLERRVTDGGDGWIREIDGEPAWSVFKEYLDGDPQTLNYEGITHLCVGLPLDGPMATAYDQYRIVTPMRLEADTGALYFPGGGVKTGDRIRLTRRDKIEIQRSASECAKRVRAAASDPAFVLQFDCAGRGQLLFGKEATEAIVRPLQAEFSDSVPWLGFHTYGEIAPVVGERLYHNYTVVLCGVSDA